MFIDVKLLNSISSYVNKIAVSILFLGLEFLRLKELEETQTWIRVPHLRIESAHHMAHMASICGTATADLAARSCEQLLGRVPLREHQVIVSTHGKEWNLDLPNLIAHAALFIVVYPIFVAKHLDVDLEVKGVKTGLVVL